MSTFEIIFLVATVPITWMMISKLQSNFIIFTTLENYIVGKAIICVLFSVIIAPLCLLYWLIKGTEEERKKILIGVGIFVVIMLGANFYDNYQAKQVAKVEQAKAEKFNKVSAEQQEYNKKREEEMKAEDEKRMKEENENRMKLVEEERMMIKQEDFIIDGIRLGEYVNSYVRFSRMKPQIVEADKKIYKLPNEDVEVDGKGTATQITSDKPIISSARGIHTNSSVQDILNAYGPKFKKTTYNNLDLYEYEMFANESQYAKKYILRFAVNQTTNLVEYIGCRSVVAQ